MTSKKIRPLIGLPACSKTVEGMPFQAGGEKYLTAVADGAGAVPVVLPSLGEDWLGEHDIPHIVDRLDGLLVTGSPSNVEPHHYGGTPSVAGTLHDPARDALTLPLIRAALAGGLPVLAICRGVQEVNVAMGGTLHQRLHELPGRMDHRSNPKETFEVRYGPAHPVALVPGSQVAALAGNEAEIVVNSLHAQGIDRLARGLTVEATAADGTIEAVRVTGAPAFALGIQWHPEWRFHETAFGRSLFGGFGDAARERMAFRLGKTGAARPKVA